MKELFWTLLGQRSQWFCENVFFISWGKWWRGVYLHFIPFYKVRVFLWGMDWQRRTAFERAIRTLQKREEREQRHRLREQA